MFVNRGFGRPAVPFAAFIQIGLQLTPVPIPPRAAARNGHFLFDHYARAPDRISWSLLDSIDNIAHLLWRLLAQFRYSRLSRSQLALCAGKPVQCNMFIDDTIHRAIVY